MTQSSEPSNQSSMSVPEMVGQLETLLEALLAHHTRLHAVVQAKREAMRAGDTQTMSSLCRMENQTVQKVADTEKQRLSLASDLTETLVPEAEQPLRLRDLAEHLPEGPRSKLLASHEQLKRKMEQVKAESSIARRAAASLANHMTGLMQTIGAVSNGVSTYSQRGAPPQAAPTLRTINIEA